MSKTMTATAATIRPEYYRLPPPGCTDEFFHFSRSYYYVGEQRGYWRLIRIRDDGKQKGITLVPFAEVAAFVARMAEAQNGGENR